MKERLIKVMASMLAVFAVIGIPVFTIVYFNFAWIMFCQLIIIIIFAAALIRFIEYIFTDNGKGKRR